MATPLEGKGSQRCCLPITAPSWGGNTNEKNRLWPRAQLGVPGGAGLGMFPIPSFPPPSSPTALDHDSRGSDRAVDRAKCLLGIPEPWISLPRTWIQQGLGDEVGMCGTWGWGATGTASLAKVTTFPGDSLKTQIGRVSSKTWCTDKCLNAHCLDHWGLFPRHPGGAPHPHCVYALRLVEGKDLPHQRLLAGQARQRNTPKAWCPRTQR